MRIWISKNSEVPIREQLVTQIVLGIVSNDLKVTERLPSTRELARRMGTSLFFEIQMRMGDRLDCRIHSIAQPRCCSAADFSL